MSKQVEKSILDNDKLFDLRERVFNCVALLLDGKKVGYAEFDTKLLQILEIFANYYNISAYDCDKICDYCEFQYSHAFGIEGL